MNISLDQLRNGLELDKDLVFAQRPAHPEMRESASIWMFDETGAFGFPRMGVEAEASSWDNRLFQANFAFADGRIMNGAGRGAPPSPFGSDGRPSVIGAGAVSFRCMEPFRRWVEVKAEEWARGMQMLGEAMAAALTPVLRSMTVAFHDLGAALEPRRHRGRCWSCNPRGNPRPLAVNGHEYRRRQLNRRKRR